MAQLLGEPPTRLYRHVNALERAGLLRLRETRANRGAVEKWYEAAAHWSAGLTRLARGDANAAAQPTARLALTLLEQARHEMTSALVDAGEEFPLLVRLVAVGSSKRALVRQHLHELLNELERAGRAEPSTPKHAPVAAGDTNERWALTIAFAPVRAPVVPTPSAAMGAAKSAGRPRKRSRRGRA